MGIEIELRENNEENKIKKISLLEYLKLTLGVPMEFF